VRILIIDDEELDLFINKKLLGMEYETEGFTSVEKAVQWAEQNTFDIALIDYYLGQDLFAHHALKKLMDLKGNTFDAFVLSNYVDKNQSQELIRSGFKDIIYKPLTVEMFKSTLNLA
jgi:DNA-binding NarL/FixJ family response regulator